MGSAAARGAVDSTGPADVREGARWTVAQRLKNDLLYVLIRAGLAATRLWPQTLTRWVCRALGLVGYLVLARERRHVRERAEAGLGHAPSAFWVCQAFCAAGEILADTLALLCPAERACRTLSLPPDCREVFRQALAQGRGVVFISAHLGPWERMAALLVEEGFAVSTVARESYDPRLTDLYERIRRPRGVKSIYRGSASAVRSVFRELRSGGAVGFLVDIPGRVPCGKASLFGADAWLALGPMRIALASGAAVLVGTCAPPRASEHGKGAASVQITHIPMPDRSGLAQDELARTLLTRVARELDQRIAAWPQAWLGLFARPRLRPHTLDR